MSALRGLAQHDGKHGPQIRSRFGFCLLLHCRLVPLKKIYRFNGHQTVKCLTGQARGLDVHFTYSL